MYAFESQGGIKSSWTYTAEAKDAGTELKVHVDWEVPESARSRLPTDEVLQELRDAGVELHLAGFKGPITDRLQAIGFIDHFGPGRVHLSTHDAMKAIGCA